jgi:type VI secretion system secreted protein Hcp
MAGDVFARFATIKGESRSDRHPGEIDVLSWSWGISRDAASPPAGGRRNTATVEDFTFVHRVDKASPQLMTACATGEHIRDVVVTVAKGGNRPLDYLVITMSDVVVTGVATTVSAEGGDDTETVTLRFGTVDLEYRPQNLDGTADAGVRFRYDVRAQR